MYREGRRSCVPPVPEGGLSLSWDRCVCTGAIQLCLQSTLAFPANVDSLPEDVFT